MHTWILFHFSSIFCNWENTLFSEHVLWKLFCPAANPKIRAQIERERESEKPNTMTNKAIIKIKTHPEHKLRSDDKCSPIIPQRTMTVLMRIYENENNKFSHFLIHFVLCNSISCLPTAHTIDILYKYLFAYFYSHFPCFKIRFLHFKAFFLFILLTNCIVWLSCA